MSNQSGESSGEASRNASSFTITFDQNPSPQIFKLHVFCCNELFDYLPLEDLMSIGQTCLRFNEIVGKYFGEKYPNAEFTCKTDDEIEFMGEGIGACSKFIQNLTIEIDSVEQFKYVATNCKSLKKISILPGNDHVWVPDMRIWRILTAQLLDGMINCIKDLLPKLEIIQLKDLEPIDNDFFFMCTNLKELEIQDVKVGNAWLHRQYPKLEHVKYHNFKRDGSNPEAWNVFFELNPQLQRFDCNITVLNMNRESFLASNITLKRLTVSVLDDPLRSIGRRHTLLTILRDLDIRNFYEKLQIIYAISFLRPQVPNLRRLDKYQFLIAGQLHLGNEPMIMTSVKELTLGSAVVPAASFPNVERIILNEPNLAQIDAFIEGSKSLKEIHIANYSYPYTFIREYKSFNILQWNIKREKLFEANKVTIYIGKNLFNLNNSHTNYSLIEIKKMRNE